MEIKHGRLAMAATVHVFITEVRAGAVDTADGRSFASGIAAPVDRTPHVWSPFVYL